MSPQGSCDGGRGAGEAAGSAGLCWRRGLGAFLQAKLCIAPEGGEPFGGTRSKVTATTALPLCLLPPSSALLQAGSSEEEAFCQLPPPGSPWEVMQPHRPSEPDFGRLAFCISTTRGRFNCLRKSCLNKVKHIINSCSWPPQGRRAGGGFWGTTTGSSCRKGSYTGVLHGHPGGGNNTAEKTPRIPEYLSFRAAGPRAEPCLQGALPGPPGLASGMAGGLHPRGLAAPGHSTHRDRGAKPRPQALSL